jgi:hypothetical protein
MKKWIMAFLAIVITCSGCLKHTNETAVKNEAYKTYFETVTSNTSFIEKSDYYSVTTKMAVLPEGGYNYYIFIDDPQIAMYAVTAIAVENNIEYSDTGKMMPSSGIYDTKYTMIPNQINKSGGFVKGIVLSGQTDQAEIEIRLMVEWKDKTGQDTHREFLLLKASASEEQSAVSEEDDSESDEEEQEE